MIIIIIILMLFLFMLIYKYLENFIDWLASSILTGCHVL